MNSYLGISQNDSKTNYPAFIELNKEKGLGLSLEQARIVNKDYKKLLWYEENSLIAEDVINKADSIITQQKLSMAKRDSIISKSNLRRMLLETQIKNKDEIIKSKDFLIKELELNLKKQKKLTRKEKRKKVFSNIFSGLLVGGTGYLLLFR